MKVPHVPPKGFMTRRQAGAYLGISQERVKQLAARYGIKENRNRGCIIYKIIDIETLGRLRNEEGLEMLQKLHEKFNL